MLANSILIGKLAALCQQKRPTRETLASCCAEMRRDTKFDCVFIAHASAPDSFLEVLASDGNADLAEACLYRIGVEDRIALAKLPVKVYSDITGKPVFNKSGSLRIQKPSSGAFLVYHVPKQDYLLLACADQESRTYDKETLENLPEVWKAWQASLLETVHHVLKPAKPDPPPKPSLDSLGDIPIGKILPKTESFYPATIPTTAGKAGEDRRRPVTLVDEVTRLFNKDYFEECIAIEVERAKRYSRNVSLVFLGVTALQPEVSRMEENVTATQVAEILAKSLRQVDVICRLEKNKYGIILPDTADNTYGIIAKRIFKFFKQIMGESPSVYLNISASTYPKHAGNHLLLIENAEKLLAQAKSVGPNKAVLPE